MPPTAPAPPGIASGSAVQRFLRGARYPFLGLRYLSGRRDLWGWVAIPGAINLVLFVMGVIGALLAAPQVLGLIWTRPAEGLALGLWILTAWLLRLALAAVVGMGVYLVAGLLSAPFNEVISERVEQAELGDAGEPWGARVFLRDTAVSMLHSLGSLVAYAGIMLPLLLVNLVPALGSALYLVLSWGVTAFFLAREMLDGVTSRRRMSLLAKLRLVRQHLALMLGFGVAMNVLLWIPLVNFLCLPIGVVGGTLLYVELERAGLAPGRRALPGPDHDLLTHP